MRSRVMDVLFTIGMMIAVAVVAAVFLWLLGDVLWHGLAKLSWAFLTTGPLDAGRSGGIAPILVSTLLILGVAVAAAAPIGLGAAVWLAEYTRRDGIGSGAVRLGLDLLAGVPSIVFGLFGNAFFSVYLGMGFSILAGWSDARLHDPADPDTHQ